jgi:predicted metal-binding membrane protein
VAANALESALKQDRYIIAAGLIGITALAWADMFYLAHGMNSMGMEKAMPRIQSWGLVDAFAMFVMWSIMMVAMMVPSASPTILLYATLNRKRAQQKRPYASTGIFLAGYVAVWTAFSVIATLAQWGLHAAALLSPIMVSTSSVFGGILLIAAGIFQWTPIKHACLNHCRSPLDFLSSHWREGTAGAFSMGLRHGFYCLGCCWALMALLFVAGVMNLLWIAVIALFVLIEKIVPNGPIIGRITGGMLIMAGVTLVLLD